MTRPNRTTLPLVALVLALLTLSLSGCGSAAEETGSPTTTAAAAQDGTTPTLQGVTLDVHRDPG